MRDSILKPVTENDIPYYLKEKFDCEKKEELLKLHSKLRLKNNANLIIFSKQMIIGRNSIGVQQCYFDTEENLPFFFNNYSRFIINFPKNIKLEFLLKFIQDQTNIPQELISLYIYEVSYQNILTRYNYSLQPLDLDLSIEEHTMSRIMNIPLIVFVYVKDQNFQLFEKNEILNESFKLDEKSEIFTSRKLNSWRFYENSKTRKLKIEKQLKNSRILFIKYLKFDSTNLEIILDDVYNIPYDANIGYLSKMIDFKEKCKRYVCGLDMIDEASYSINFLLEKNIVLSDFNKLMTFTELIDPQLTLNKIIEEQENLIVIVNINFSNKNPFTSSNLQSTKEIIENLCLKSLSHVNVNVFNYNTYCYENKTNKYLFNFFDSEDKIKQSLLKIIFKNDESHFTDVLSTKFYLNIHQQLINREIQQKEVNIDYLEIISDKDPLLLKEYPLIKYLTNQDTAIFFNLNIFPKTEESFFQTDFFLFDEDNNPIEKVCIAMPKRLKSCKEIIDYIFEPLLMKFYKIFVF